MVELIAGATRSSSGDFLQQPPLELYESDVVWSFLSSPDSTSPSPPFMHDRRRHNRFSTPQSGLSAVLGNDHLRLFSSQSKIIPASPRSENVQVKFHQSAPVNIPVWPKQFHGNFNEINDGDGYLKRLDEVEEEEDEKMVPPHVIVARSHVTFSVFEGVGRTLKGRDLRRVRNAVFRKTGFID
ncbi:protein S40-2-like [Primulina tabacum]|uniref:protein S40-2-like n=1 Tax=Primulina tabacum TaxID=48773 RepID=UPI003F5A51D8